MSKKELNTVNLLWVDAADSDRQRKYLKQFRYLVHFTDIVFSRVVSRRNRVKISVRRNRNVHNLKHQVQCTFLHPAFRDNHDDEFT